MSISDLMGILILVGILGAIAETLVVAVSVLGALADGLATLIMAVKRQR